MQGTENRHIGCICVFLFNLGDAYLVDQWLLDSNQRQVWFSELEIDEPDSRLFAYLIYSQVEMILLFTRRWKA